MGLSSQEGADVELAGRRVLVVGLARTGTALAKFLLEKKASVTVTDQKGREELGDMAKGLEAQGCVTRFGCHAREDFLASELIVISPGVPFYLPQVKEAIQAGVEVISEVELASRFLRCPILAITGTNGKTTTVSLIGEMLREGGIDAFVGGNIGRPLIECAYETGTHRRPNPRFAVVELSSFQLEGITQFRPWVAVVLNLTEDHLDRYASMDEYIHAKVRIFENQTNDDFAVLPVHAPWADRIPQGTASRRIRFSIGGCPEADICWQDGFIRFVWHETEEIYPTSRVVLPGTHNLENMMAALVVARLSGVTPSILQQVIERFPGLEHRLEMVCEADGVRYYNDSKGTTVASVIKALEAFSQPVLLIAGGKDKGGDFSQLGGYITGRVKRLFLLGQARDRMAKELAGTTEIEKVKDLKEAVRRAREHAAPGDVVLLSPACSSFDMFHDYEDRGRQFKGIIREMIQRKGYIQ